MDNFIIPHTGCEQTQKNQLVNMLNYTSKLWYYGTLIYYGKTMGKTMILWKKL